MKDLLVRQERIIAALQAQFDKDPRDPGVQGSLATAVHVWTELKRYETKEQS